MKKNRKGTKLAEWQRRAKDGGECNECKSYVKILNVDHIIPCHILEAFDDDGSLTREWEENFQLVCMPCNRFKNARLDRKNRKTIPLLEKFVRHIAYASGINIV